MFISVKIMPKKIEYCFGDVMQETQFETFGHFILLEKLAAGGMAEVFLAKKVGASGVQKFMAIKRILPQFSEAEEYIQMFKEEAKIAVNLNHSNVVSIHEFGVENHQFYLVMEYVEGRNLRQVLNKMKKLNQTFTISQIVFIVKQVAAGLDHAHRCLDGSTGRPLNIIHRDMSPQNIMISFEGENKIVDFGIAKASNQIETTKAGTLKGKFGYMSPEQAEGLPVDHRTDIFSLGIILWELIANDRLFLANNELNTLRKIREGVIPNLKKLNPTVPPELEKIVAKALSRDRNNRYQSSSDFNKDLTRFLNRHDPDFSQQDFSIFIRTLFSQEILDSRRRLVEYAQYLPEEKVVATATKATTTAEATQALSPNSYQDLLLSRTQTNHFQDELAGPTELELGHEGTEDSISLQTQKSFNSEEIPPKEFQKFGSDSPPLPKLSLSNLSLSTSEKLETSASSQKNIGYSSSPSRLEVQDGFTSPNFKVGVKAKKSVNLVGPMIWSITFAFFAYLGNSWVQTSKSPMAYTAAEKLCQDLGFRSFCAKMAQRIPLGQTQIASENLITTLQISSSDKDVMIFVEGRFVGTNDAKVNVPQNSQVKLRAVQRTTKKVQEYSIPIENAQTKEVKIPRFQ